MVRMPGILGKLIARQRTKPIEKVEEKVAEQAKPRKRQPKKAESAVGTIRGTVDRPA